MCREKDEELIFLPFLIGGDIFCGLLLSIKAKAVLNLAQFPDPKFPTPIILLITLKIKKT